MQIPSEVNGEPPEVDGAPPDLTNLVCERLLIEEYWRNGNLIDPASVIWLRFANVWHRLYFDCGIVFWRTSSDEPEPYTMPELNAEVRITDVGTALGVAGDVVNRYETRSIIGGAEVAFMFDSGKRLAFSNVNDRTAYTG